MTSNKRGKRRQNTRAVVRTEVRAKGTPAERVERAAVRLRAGECDCRALSAFHAWRDVPMPPSFNVGVDFSQAYGIPPAGKRAVIEQVTATIEVPQGEFARLRLFTSLGFYASNLDFVLTPQGLVGGQQILECTHLVRVYSDSLIEFNVNRDNAQTTGNAFICISGYLIAA